MIYFSQVLGICFFPSVTDNGCGNINQFHNFSRDLIEIDTAEKGFHTLLPPLKESACFSDNEYSNLQAMYDLLYPNSLITRISRSLNGIKANDNKQGIYSLFP